LRVFEVLALRMQLALGNASSRVNCLPSFGDARLHQGCHLLSGFRSDFSLELVHDSFLLLDVLALTDRKLRQVLLRDGMRQVLHRGGEPLGDADILKSQCCSTLTT
jgi:hypothetical protein